MHAVHLVRALTRRQAKHSLLLLTNTQVQGLLPAPSHDHPECAKARGAPCGMSPGCRFGCTTEGTSDLLCQAGR